MLLRKILFALSLCWVLDSFLFPFNIPVWAQTPYLVVQGGHSDRINSLAIATNGMVMASGSDDQTIKLWDLKSGRELRSLANPSGKIGEVVFSPDGRTLATGGQGGQITLWDVQTGEEKHTFTAFPTQYMDRNVFHQGSLAFSPDGIKLASIGWNGKVDLWEVQTGRQLKSLPGHSRAVRSVAFSPDGKKLATASDDDTIKVWDVVTNQELYTHSNPPNSQSRGFDSVGFSQDGKMLVGSTNDGLLLFWNGETGAENKNLIGGHSSWHNHPSYSPRSIAFSSDKKTFFQTIVHGPLDWTVRAWDVASGLEILPALSQEGNYWDLKASAIALIPDAKILAIASGSSERGVLIKVWNTETGAEGTTFGSYTKPVRSLALSADGKRLASGTWDGMVKLWDLSSDSELVTLNGRLHAERPGGHYRVSSVAFSPDNHKLASGIFDGTVVLWDVATGKRLKTFFSTGDTILSIAFSPDGKTIASDGTREGHVRLIDITLDEDAKPKDLFPNRPFASALALSPDGITLATGSGNGHVALWDLTLRRDWKHPLEQNPSGWRPLGNHAKDKLINSVSFSPDGKFLASGSQDATIKLWEVDSGRRLGTLLGHSHVVNSVAFRPDGKMLATGSSDKTTKLWSVPDGAELYTLHGHSGFVTSVGFSSDGRILVTGGGDGSVKLWEVSSGTELATLVSVDQNDWLVSTPDGLFDGSPDGWKRIIWRFDNKTFNYAPVEAYFNDYFYPGLLQEIFQGKRPKAPSGKELENRDRRRPSVVIRQVQPPLSSLNIPAEKMAPMNEGRTVAIQIEATENVDQPVPESQPRSSGVQDLRLFRNGTLVKVWHGDVFDKSRGCVEMGVNASAQPTGPRKAICTAVVSIVAGGNEFTAYAFNHDNLKSDDADPLVVTGDESLTRKGVFYVLAVGINQYQAAGYDLKFAVADVEEIGAELKLQQDKIGEYARTEVISLTDELATKANILFALRRFAGDNQENAGDKGSSQLKKELEKIRVLQPEDALVLYYAGHGSAKEEHFYLMPHDVLPSDDSHLRASSLSDVDLNEALERLDAGKLLMVIDACQSGQMLGAAKEGRGPMNSKGLAQLAFDKGMYILAAAQSYQAAKEVSRSQEGKKIEHGLLTFALLEGLNQAKVDRTGKIRERDWMKYAVDQVPLMQVDEMKQRQLAIEKGSSSQQGRGAQLVFAEGDDPTLEYEKRRVQRPRVFYRRELETQPLIVAQP